MRRSRILKCRACAGTGTEASFIGRRPDKCKQCKGSGRWVQTGARVVKATRDRLRFYTQQELSELSAAERFGGER